MSFPYLSCLVFLVLSALVVSCFLVLNNFRTCKLQARRKHDAVMLRREKLNMKKEVLSHLVFI